MMKMKVLAWSGTGILGKEKLWAAHEERINANECPLNSSDPLSCSCNCSSCFKVDVHTCTEAIRWGSSEKVEAFCTRRWWKTEVNLIFTLLRPLPCLRTNFPVDSVWSVAIFERKTQTDH